MAPLWIVFSALNASEPLRVDSLLSITKFPGVPGTHLITPRSMKGWVKLGATWFFWTWISWMGVLCSNHQIIAPWLLSLGNIPKYLPACKFNNLNSDLYSLTGHVKKFNFSKKHWIFHRKTFWTWIKCKAIACKILDMTEQNYTFIKKAVTNIRILFPF